MNNANQQDRIIMPTLKYSLNYNNITFHTNIENLVIVPPTLENKNNSFYSSMYHMIKKYQLIDELEKYIPNIYYYLLFNNEDRFIEIFKISMCNYVKSFNVTNIIKLIELIQQKENTNKKPDNNNDTISDNLNKKLLKSKHYTEFITNFENKNLLIDKNAKDIDASYIEIYLCKIWLTTIINQNDNNIEINNNNYCKINDDTLQLDFNNLKLNTNLLFFLNNDGNYSGLITKEKFDKNKRLIERLNINKTQKLNSLTLVKDKDLPYPIRPHHLIRNLFIISTLGKGYCYYSSIYRMLIYKDKLMSFIENNSVNNSENNYLYDINDELGFILF